MSNVFFSAAIRLCCDARVASKLSGRISYSSFSGINASRRFLNEAIPCKSMLASHAHLQLRALSATASLQSRVRGPRKRRTTFPSSKLTPPPSKASHTEGVLDTEEWRNYDPDGGLPLPSGELSQAEIDAIFTETQVDAATGNYILCAMHWRRMSGALIDIGVDLPKHLDVNPRQALQALNYLRETYPNVDEVVLSERWVEEESDKMSAELIDRAVKMGFYKPLPKPEGEEEEDETLDENKKEEEPVEVESLQGTAYGRARNGTSALEGLIRAWHARKAEKEAARLAKVAQKEQNMLHAARGPLELGGGVQRALTTKRFGTAVLLIEPERSLELQRLNRPEWVKYYEEQATIIKDNIVPQLSLLRRLGPSLLVMLSTLGLCFYLSEHYTPPPSEARLLPSIPPSVATIGGLSILMFGILVLSRLPPFWRINNKYFSIVPVVPVALSNVGAIFRHDPFSHLVLNLVTLWLIGTVLHEDVGRGTFLAIFLGSGVIGTYSSLTASVLGKQWTTWIYGSSGAVQGVLGALCTLHPSSTIHMLGYDVPVAAWAVLAVVLSYETYSVLRKGKKTTDHVGHLTGMLSGIAAAVYLEQKHAKEKQAASTESVMTAAEA